MTNSKSGHQNDGHKMMNSRPIQDECQFRQALSDSSDEQHSCHIQSAVTTPSATTTTTASSSGGGGGGGQVAQRTSHAICE
jgi:hypothetical protein